MFPERGLAPMKQRDSARRGRLEESSDLCLLEKILYMRVHQHSDIKDYFCSLPRAGGRALLRRAGIHLLGPEVRAARRRFGAHLARQLRIIYQVFSNWTVSGVERHERKPQALQSVRAPSGPRRHSGVSARLQLWHRPGGAALCTPKSAQIKR